MLSSQKLSKTIGTNTSQYLLKTSYYILHTSFHTPHCTVNYIQDTLWCSLHVTLPTKIQAKHYTLYCRLHTTTFWSLLHLTQVCDDDGQPDLQSWPKCSFWDQEVSRGCRKTGLSIQGHQLTGSHCYQGKNMSCSQRKGQVFNGLKTLK